MHLALHQSCELEEIQEQAQLRNNERSNQIIQGMIAAIRSDGGTFDDINDYLASIRELKGLVEAA
jgi:hypothetical protein